MDINELESYRLQDAVKFHKQLNPRLWSANEHLQPDVKSKLLAIADDFCEFLGITGLEIKDITVSGSNAAYTYTDHSDIDLHIVVDLPESKTSDIYQELFDAKKYQYNDQHDFKIGGYDVELYVQDANETHHSQGIYSLLNNDWVRVPSRRQPSIDDISVRNKYEDIGHRIDAAIKSGSGEQLENIATKVRTMRQSGLDKTGEFGPENLAFKILRNNGTLDILRQARLAAKDREMSLEAQSQPKERKKYGHFGGMWFPDTHDAVVDETELVKENPLPKDIKEILPPFVKSCAEYLKIEKTPKIILKRDPEWTRRNGTFGRFDPDTHSVTLAVSNRHPLDILRTLAHELTHARQNELATMPVDAGETGSPYEDDANAQAGRIMRYWVDKHPEFFKDIPLEEDYDPNGPPPGPETKPTMPKGTVRVDVSDMYDWYKLGKDISNLKGADKSKFGKGPPSTIVSFGDENTEHKYIKDLEHLGLTTTDIDPVDPDQPKNTPRQKVDPTFNVNESFDKPYPVLRWETGDFGDVDAIARLDDNTFLSIMFNKGVSKDSKEETWSVEFYRNNSQEVTGEGDAQRVFATVISAMQTFIKKYKPNRIIFTASKEVEQGQNAQSRARLYDSLVQRYARAWGFRAFRADTGDKVIYELNRIQPVAKSVVETINLDILNKRFRHKQVIGDYTYTASVEMFMGEPLLNIKAYDRDREIGHILFEIIVRSPGGKRKPSEDYLESGGTEVDPAYRNKGVASTMYAYAKMLGNDIRASYNQTSQGQAMWAAWEKAGDAKHLAAESREKFNLDVLKPGFRWSEEINGITYLVRTQWDNMPEVVAKVNNREVGRATFTDHSTRSGLESVSTYVSPKWQGHGIAKNMYAVMRMLGANIQPSETQTAMGKDMWAKWKKAGDTKHLTSLNAKSDQPGLEENMDHNKDSQAVEELKAALIARKQKLQSANDDQVYDTIDSIMTRIAKSHSISGQQLHDMWVDKYKQIPDTWIMHENFADGKNPGRKGLAKRVGVNTKASVSSLRKTAKNSTGEKQRMAHWLANMKAGKAKHEDVTEAVSDNYLYHATMPAGMMRILRTGAIKATDRPQPSTKARTQYPTISTTRSKQYAESAEFVDFLNLTNDGNAVILVFDRNAVANHYKMFGTSQGTQTVGDEFEEVIVAPKGSMPIRGTLKGFYFNPNRTAEIQEYQDVPWFQELLTSPYYMGPKQGVAEDAKTTEHYNGIEISMEKEDDEIMVRAMMAGGRELGHVLFVIDGEYLAPQDLEVDERYQGQGIAATMYDYVKSKGYKIRRSGQQTDAGAGFWDKHKPGKNVWEQGVTEGKDFDRCFDQACKLYDRAVSKNLEPKLVQVADFQGDGNGADPRWLKLPQHVWQHYVVIVGDQVLDPTAKQFGDTMPTQYQVSDLDRLWAKQYQIRPRQGVAEATGFIPVDSKLAHDPRYVSGLTVDIKPGETQRQAKKLGWTIDKNGNPPLLMQELERQWKIIKEGREDLAEQDLFEIKMTGKNLRAEAAKTGAQAGMEFEMIVPNLENDDEDSGDMEPDYEYDESVSSIQDAYDFFYDGDYNSRGDVTRLREKMQNEYWEWLSEAFDTRWDGDESEFVYNYLKENASADEIAEILGIDVSDGSEYVADKQAYRDATEKVVEESYGNYWYDAAREDAQEDFNQNADLESDWLESRDLNAMSDIENEYEINWPHWQSMGGGGGELTIDDFADEFSRMIGKPINSSQRYHGARREAGHYVVEPDGSLTPDDSNDGGLEFVSPPMPIDEMISDFNKVVSWAKKRGCYTNDSTGLHINVSVPNFDRRRLDFVKLAILMGDEYVLDQFGRNGNFYTKSAMKIVKDRIAQEPANAQALLDKMKGQVEELASRSIHAGYTDKYTSINVKDGYIEFRSPGGDWLDSNLDKVENTLLRFTVALNAAMNPEMYREEYLKKLYKILAPEGSDDSIKYFAKYAAGELPQSALKSFVRQAQLERKLKADPTKGEKYWWRVDKEGRGKSGASIEVVATSKEEALEKAASNWNLKLSALSKSAVYPIKRFEDGPITRYEIYNKQTGNSVEPADGITNDADALVRLNDYIEHGPHSLQRGQASAMFGIRRAGGDPVEPIRATVGAPQPAGSVGRATTSFNGQWKIIDGLGRQLTVFRPYENTRAAANELAAIWARENEFDGNYQVEPADEQQSTPATGSTTDLAQQRSTPGTFTGAWRVVDSDTGQELYRFSGVGNVQADANRVAADWLRQNAPEDSDMTQIEVLPIVS